jgi:hypothetical protein
MVVATTLMTRRAVNGQPRGHEFDSSSGTHELVEMIVEIYACASTAHAATTD